jgi:endonuclease/exonuclease/phosphatase family metal-dependent hydrolase
VVTFNIHSALHGRAVEISQIAAELEALKPDVVLLQEVDAHRGYSGWVDMPAVLSGALDMTYAYGVNVVGQTTSHGQSQYGTLVLARFPILSKSNTSLVNERGLQQRGLLKVVLDVGGTDLSVYNTHLENGTSSGSHVDLRTRQAEQAAAIIGSDPNPVILGGDFNSGPGSAAMNAFARVVSDPWPRVGLGSPASHGAPHPTIRIDYLLQRGDALTPVRAQIGSTAVSDHEPVITDYRVAGTRLVGDCVQRR